jgi:hypothetical protein
MKSNYANFNQFALDPNSQSLAIAEDYGYYYSK